MNVLIERTTQETIMGGRGSSLPNDECPPKVEFAGRWDSWPTRLLTCLIERDNVKD